MNPDRNPHLSGLAARVVAAFLIGLGLGAAHSLIEGDWLRLLPAAATAALFGLLQLVNVARYSGTFDWDDVRTWIYLLGLAYLLAFGLERFGGDPGFESVMREMSVEARASS